MKYREIKPTGFLKNFVQCFWYYETDCEVQHTILPDGYFDLIAEFENDTLITVKLTGVWTKPKDISIPKNIKFFAVRFKLLAIEYLFQKEIKTIVDTTIKLPFTFWNLDTYKSYQFDLFVTDTLNSLETSLKHLNEIDSRKLNLFEIVYLQKTKTVFELSSQIFWSSRQINRYFSTQFGISLKEFLKIVRCNASYEEISNGNLSPQSDFFDQAHFIKEIKKYTGVTPKELSKNKNDRFLQLSKLEEK
ncbi:AraC-like DNA-binding protein [Flavobacterium sp. HSC-32F16]|uniref:helix-turn-helix domain-containing protein n=1 Tax=Flavobacterium sp. HSC-32F16 TaxID=2910964 RepID=UPI0020A407E5|nr:AraC family transcriptional regulator [Flavobacterium sp. HSC-32F16]MCP2027192.1 AraC-like DNA-binding protein [Flavobacterium sp. HSC-32F16]